MRAGINFTKEELDFICGILTHEILEVAYGKTKEELDPSDADYVSRIEAVKRKLLGV